MPSLFQSSLNTTQAKMSIMGIKQGDKMDGLRTEPLKNLHVQQNIPSLIKLMEPTV
jgi:hypothetical protein